MRTEESTIQTAMTDAEWASYVAAVARDEPWLLNPDAWEIDNAPDAVPVH